ncbi:efflux RND transporter periplasmic adaptor subunit [bacterium]|nr:efflux RND transporter periplasmic adaptor subunit [bacterium]
MTWRTYAVLGASSLAAITLTNCGQKPAPAELIPVTESGRAGSLADAVTMRVTRVETRSFSDRVLATGRLVTREEAAVASELGGFRVQSVLVDEGDWVEAGQPLVRLDDTLLQAQIDQAAAQLEQQRINARFRQSQWERVEGLQSTGALSVEAIEQRRMEAEAARASVAVAEAALQEMKLRQKRLTVRAPVTGRVLSRNVRPGEISGVGGASPWFRIALDGLVELDAELQEAVVASIKPGEAAEVVLPSGQSVMGKVRYVSPRVDESTGLGRARISLPYDAALRPGGFGEAAFTAVAREAVTVPASAVRYEAGGPLLMVVGDDNLVKRVPVKLGERLKDFVELLEGPPPGSLVLAIGAAFVLDGDPVNPVESDDPPAPASGPEQGER